MPQAEQTSFIHGRASEATYFEGSTWVLLKSVQLTAGLSTVFHVSLVTKSLLLPSAEAAAGI